MDAKKRIFIADDDEIVLESLKKLLVLSGFEVKVVTNAKDIVQQIRIFKPQVILLDLVMPNIGGIEICQMLNDDKDTKGIPIIIVSALGGYTDIEKAYKNGVVGYFIKPYDFEKLLIEVNKVIAYKEGKNL